MIEDGSTITQRAANKALLDAAENRNFTVMKNLFKYGAYLPFQKTNEIFLEASQEGEAEIIKLLFQYSRRPFSQITINEALLNASGCGFLEISKTLLNHGADIQAYDFVDAAAYRGYFPMVQFLIGHGANMGNAIEEAELSGDTEMLDWLKSYLASQDERKVLKKAASTIPIFEKTRKRM